MMKNNGSNVYSLKDQHLRKRIEAAIAQLVTAEPATEAEMDAVFADIPEDTGLLARRELRGGFGARTERQPRRRAKRRSRKLEEKTDE